MKQILAIPGEHAGSRFVVVVNKERKFLQRATYNLLLELVAARLGTLHGYLYTSDIEISLGSAQYTRRLFKLLREQLGILPGNGFIKRHNRCTFLDVEPSQIVIAPAALDMPPEVVDAKVLAKLVAALTHHFGDAPANPVRHRRLQSV